MTTPADIRFATATPEEIAAFTGRLALILPPEGAIGPEARRVDRLARGAVGRAMAGKAWGKLKPGEALDLAFPAGLAAEALQLVKLPRKAGVTEARRAGAAIGKSLGESGAMVLAGAHPQAADISFGLALRAYDFDAYRSGDRTARGAVTLSVTRPEAVAATARPLMALAEGVFFTRDLVNEPANVLTTTDFAARLAAMQELGLEVEILEEEELAKLGMRALLGVGQGSESPSKVVVMQWNGGIAGEAPLALVGKGVVFDTGGISIKPAVGMEEMTMDMGGAGVVAGVMRTLALRRARANVVGLVGLVENMPDGRAQRPGDIVRSMKGDTIEVINTDAEGRLVLADVLWYAQDRFKPACMIDLATLTGAIIIALGHDNAGVFANDDTLANAVLAAAAAEGEGAWRMPMGDPYDKLIKSRLADMKNTGGRPGGSITAAQFLRRFVRDETPWCHIDIAGVALPPSETALAPKGATGWGVMTLDRMIRDRFEGLMGEARFYHLTRSGQDAVLAQLLPRSLQSGWHVVVRGCDSARLDHIDRMLWLGAEEGFLPHGLAGGPNDALQPILLTTGTDRPNGARCLMCIDGAPVEPEEARGLERVCVIFDGSDPAARDVARDQWRRLTGAGIAAEYWSEESGRWQKKAESAARPTGGDAG